MNHVLIGDIHSQADKLKSALTFIQNNIQDPRIVFLGDLFDSKNDYSDSYTVYKLVKEAEQNLNAITIQSNHQDKFIRFLRGNKVTINNGLNKTISDFILHNVSHEEMYAWLSRQAYGIVFRDAHGIEFRCAHAYFSSDIQVQEYETQYLVKAVSNRHKHEFLYGLQSSKESRVNWWESDNSANNFIRVAGHYQTLYTNLNNKSLVLDSCCGNTNGKLSIFNVNTRTLHQF
jgi:hypothetical protein